MATNFTIHSSSALTDEEDVLRCLNNLFSVWAGSMPLNREFGLDWSLLAQPIPMAQSDFVMEVTEKVDKFEPRVTVTGVKFSYDSEGKIIPEIYIEESEDSTS